MQGKGQDDDFPLDEEDKKQSEAAFAEVNAISGLPKEIKAASIICRMRAHK